MTCTVKPGSTALYELKHWCGFMPELLSLVWTNKGREMASLRCADNAESLCEKSYCWQLSVTVFYHVILSDSRPLVRVQHSLESSDFDILTTLWSPGAGTRSADCNRPGCQCLPRGGGLRQCSPAPELWSALCLHPVATWRRSERQRDTQHINRIN